MGGQADRQRSVSLPLPSPLLRSPQRLESRAMSPTRHVMDGDSRTRRHKHLLA